MEGLTPSICGRTIKQNYSYAAFSKNDADGNPIANSSASYAKDNLPTLYQISSTRYATYTYDSINAWMRFRWKLIGKIFEQDMQSNGGFNQHRQPNA